MDVLREYCLPSVESVKLWKIMITPGDYFMTPPSYAGDFVFEK